jgi:hypothetical protein
MRLSITALLLALGFLAARADAQSVWPGSSDWKALQVSGSNYTDPSGPTPDTIDIRGDSTYAAGYWSYDTTNANLFFRMRLDKKPSNPTSVWQVLLDTDTDTDIDWVLQLDESGDNQMELVAASTGGTKFSDVSLSSSSSWSGATSTYSRFVDPTGDSSNFDGNSDAFLDMYIPWSSFSSATGLTTSSSFRIGLSTSTTHTAIGKDFPLALTSSSSVKDGFSDPIAAVPEPGTWALFLAGLGLVLASHRVRRRRAGKRAVEAAPVSCGRDAE